ncbi:MAG: response regulator [Rickettsiales bacterium]|nr:response regulator [Pseudomonadota bacterium]MDA0965454.1 response regulator [Pseudomonadota bacterium]MDG4542779.1 response regulator [Rickettsiales bacterium]MDG4544773.1 response regulator [Rickettsiales bacterium]MDG4546895.1 response regulator [Rickettsiales bacterium]
MAKENKKKNIFIVEDNELNLKLFKDILNANGFDTSYTQDGFEAFSLIKKHKPDTILMDIQLHGISGFDIIKEIKSDDEIKHIPIIVVTAFAMKDDKKKIMDSGCEAYIAKPISINPFLDTISKYANSIVETN